MRGIGLKIAMVTAGCLLFAAAVSAIAVDRIVRSSMERLAIDRVQRELAHEADEVQSALLARDRLQVHEILTRSAGGKDDVEYAFVVSERGAVLASSLIDGVPRDILDAHRLPPGTLSDVKVLETEHGLVLDVAQALVDGRGGELHRGIQAREVSAVAHTTLIALLLVQAGALLLAVLASFLLADRLARPLGRLLLAVQRVGAGDLSARAEVAPGDEIGQLGTAFDSMTGMLRAAHLAREQMAARARGIVLCSPTALLVTDPSARILSANPAAEALTGLSEDELKGKGLAELFVAGPERKPVGDLGPVLGQEGVTLSYEMSLRSPTGVRPVAFHSAPMKDGGAGVQGYVVEVRDWSHLRSSIEALKLQRDRLEESEADLGGAPSAGLGKGAETHLVRSERLVTLGQLAASVAHEINNPLFGILTCAKVLERELGVLGAGSERLLKAIGTIRSEATRCSETLRRFLDFARVEPPRRQEVAVFRVLEEVRELIAPQAAEQGVTIVCELAGPDTVQGDPTQLHQAFLNIALNAIQAMPRGGTLGIVARPSDGRAIEVLLRDTGAGIRPEDLPRVFEPFFTTKERGVGTGLGLSIARVIVTRHGGRMAITSEVGRGTEALVTLPLSPVKEGRA